MNNGTPLRKGVSLGGPRWAVDANFINSYTFNNAGTTPNRTYIRDESGAKWVKLWVNWAALQPNAVGSRAESWNQLSAQTAAWNRLDEQIRAANVDGLGVILTMYHQYPVWSNGGNLGYYGSRGEHPLNRLPTQVQQNGPFDWFVGYCLARYKYGVPATTNGQGPREGYTLGNPVQAFIWAFEMANEPNQLNWTDPPVSHAGTVGVMMTTAENAAYYYGTQLAPTNYPVWILGPAASDVPSSPPAGQPSDYQTGSYETFVTAFLNYLQGWWTPRIYVGFSWHNYHDIKYGYDRIAVMRNLLYSKNWKRGGDRLIFITEGGYKLPDRYHSLPVGQTLNDTADTQLKWQGIQSLYVGAEYFRLSSFPDVYMWLQHCVGLRMSDTGFDSALRNALDAPTNPYQQRELYWRFRHFVGSTTP